MSRQLTICLHRGSTVMSRLIQWQTRSAYSHASMVLPDGLHIEAHETRGVQAFPRLTVAPGEVVDLFTVAVTKKQADKIAEFAREQLGKRYDWLMVLRFVTRRQEARATTGKWFCSELVYAACQQAGVELLRNTEPWEVSPGLLARSPLLVTLALNRTAEPLAA
jgi:uncharacterized protein YycO